MTKRAKNGFGSLFPTLFSDYPYFLYAPIFTMMVLSFNQSKSRTHWGGFTLKKSLLNLNEMLEIFEKF